MIYAELAGGLGNQMFIYAFARALGLQHGEEVTLLDRQDWRDGAPAHTRCALSALNISPEVKLVEDPGFAKTHLPRQNLAKVFMIKYEQRQGMMSRDWQRFEARMAPVLNAVGVHFATDGYTPVTRGGAKDFLAWGYFQSRRYFAPTPEIEAAVRAELRTKNPPPLPPALQAAAYPVCVHLRRGDYQKPENRVFDVCTPEYYATAVKKMAARHPEATLFVFSDDPAWAKENLETAGLCAHYLPRGDAAGDLALMARCAGFIISNSTYSWWAQYLSGAAQKLVFAPQHWYRDTKQTDLYSADWQLIPV